ncbi:response regulator transcription factor [soil metagenome]
MAKLLLVDDDTSLADTVSRYLKQTDHYVVECAHTGEDALDLMTTYEYDVIVLDWGLPEMSGLEVLNQYRDQGGKSRVLMLTAKSELTNKEKGFNAGADDYLTKPFTVKELALRIKALLRRPTELVCDQLTIADIVLNSKTFQVTKGGELVELTRKEFALLELLMRYPNQVFSPDAILDRLWKSESDTSADSIKVWIKRLRNKIENNDTKLIRNVHGVGYKLELPG